MEVDHLDLKKLVGIVAYAVDNASESNKEFYLTIYRALDVYAKIIPLLEFAKRSTLTIPWGLAMDLNSIVLEFGHLPHDILKGK